MIYLSHKESNSSLRRDSMFQKKFWIGCLGFLGFFGMRYVSSGNILDLAYLGFFAFFGFFFIGRISGDRRDERYQENR